MTCLANRMWRERCRTSEAHSEVLQLLPRFLRTLTLREVNCYIRNLTTLRLPCCENAQLATQIERYPASPTYSRCTSPGTTGVNARVIEDILASLAAMWERTKVPRGQPKPWPWAYGPGRSSQPSPASRPPQLRLQSSWSRGETPCCVLSEFWPTKSLA